MAQTTLPTGLQIEYETFGSSDDDAVLLVCGFTSQLTSWRTEFCERLAAAGRFVIRYDNRDVGLSEKLDGESVDLGEAMAAIKANEQPTVPYTLSDMAADGIGLLDALNIDRAHVAGVSMGGMIVQTMAIEHPDRLLSAASIMSTTGESTVGQAADEAMELLLAPPPSTRDDAIEFAKRMAIWSSKRYFDPDEHAEFIAESFDRSHYPEGAPRQLAAIYASRSRADALAEVTVPMLVIHGLDDRLIDPSGGRRTAELVPGASLLELADMGHDLPRPLWPIITGALLGHQDVAAEGGARRP